MDIIPCEQLESPDAKLMIESLKKEIYNALMTLKPREAEVIRLYFGLDIDISKTLEDIGSKLGLTRERVRQIKEKAVQSLRSPDVCAALTPYLG